MFSFLLSSFQVMLPGSIVSTESEELVVGSTKSILLCNAGTTLSGIKEGIAMLNRSVLK
jgi:hypothetical protein